MSNSKINVVMAESGWYAIHKDDKDNLSANKIAVFECFPEGAWEAIEAEGPNMLTAHNVETFQGLVYSPSHSPVKDFKKQNMTVEESDIEPMFEENFISQISDGMVAYKRGRYLASSMYPDDSPEENAYYIGFIIAKYFKKTFAGHNKKDLIEDLTEKIIRLEQRIEDLEDQRDGVLDALGVVLVDDEDD